MEENRKKRRQSDASEGMIDDQAEFLELKDAFTD